MYNFNTFISATSIMIWRCFTMKNKHLTLSDRITIQEMLERGESFR